MRKPSPALVISIAALVVAMSGTAIAAKQYVITSTKQIKPTVLKQLRGAQGPRGYTGPRGAQGLAGVQGTTGPQGGPGISGLNLVTGADLQIPAGDFGTAVANCPAGQKTVSGGFFSSIGSAFATFGNPGAGQWVALIDNPSSITITVHAYAVCGNAT